MGLSPDLGCRNYWLCRLSKTPAFPAYGSACHDKWRCSGGGDPDHHVTVPDITPFESGPYCDLVVLIGRDCRPGNDHPARYQSLEPGGRHTECRGKLSDLLHGDAATG